MFIYHAHLNSIYFDLLAFSLSTADPFVHPVTCLLVSQRYREGYKAAIRDILSMLGKWTSGCMCDSKVHVHPTHSLSGGVSQSDSHNRNLGSWSHSLKKNGRNVKRNTAGGNLLKLEVIVEAVETQE